jgi:hypothetical protein
MTLDIPLLYSHDEKVSISGYYEVFDNIYQANTYFIVIDYYTPEVANNVGAMVDEFEITNFLYYTTAITPVAVQGVINTVTYYANAVIVTTCESPIELVKPYVYSELKTNSLAMRHRYKRPLARLENNNIRIMSEYYYHTIEARLTYIKVPKRYNYVTNTMCEIRDNEGILRIAVKLLESYLLNKDVNSQQVQEKNSVVIN